MLTDLARVSPLNFHTHRSSQCLKQAFVLTHLARASPLNFNAPRSSHSLSIKQRGFGSKGKHCTSFPPLPPPPKRKKEACLQNTADEHQVKHTLSLRVFSSSMASLCWAFNASSSCLVLSWTCQSK